MPAKLLRKYCTPETAVVTDPSVTVFHVESAKLTSVHEPLTLPGKFPLGSSVHRHIERKRVGFGGLGGEIVLEDCVSVLPFNLQPRARGPGVSIRIQKSECVLIVGGCSEA